MVMVSPVREDGAIWQQTLTGMPAGDAGKPMRQGLPGARQNPPSSGRQQLKQELALRSITIRVIFLKPIKFRGKDVEDRNSSKNTTCTCLLVGSAARIMLCQ